MHVDAPETPWQDRGGRAIEEAKSIPMQGMEELNMATIKITDLNEDRVVTEEELKHVKGGALLLSAVQTSQKVNLLDSAYKLLGDGSVRTLGDGSV